jgi:methylmalonyl-CoA mutase N-terminal domain/subunit
LRTQQILAYESGVADTVDPLAGSYFVESLTDAVEAAARRVMGAVADAGGAVAAIEARVVQGMIEDAAYAHARRVESGEIVVVGVNRFVSDSAAVPETPGMDPELEARQAERLASWRAARDGTALDTALAEVAAAAGSTANVLYPMKQALALGATVGEVSGVLEGVFGRYRPGE